MATWDDVVESVSDLPDVTASEAHEGSPAFDVHHRQFLRQRVDSGRTVLQFWVRDTGVQDALVQTEPDTFWVHHRFTIPSTMAWLDELDSERCARSWSSRGLRELRRAWSKRTKT